MTFVNMFFSFKGRIGRLTYLGSSLALLAIELVGVFLMDRVQQNLNAINSGSIVLFQIAGYAFLIMIVWSFLAITIKRWHDRDKSGWWIFIGLIPIIGPLWVTIELIFLAGTSGPNKYGQRAY
jgi:uncharacterized membrane protein YhaH (DUF805 family)